MLLNIKYIEIVDELYWTIRYRHQRTSWDLRPEIRKNILMKYYEAGHMMYTHQPSLQQFRKDLEGFIMDTSR